MFKNRKIGREIALFALYIYDLESMPISELFDLEWYYKFITYFDTKEDIPFFYPEKKKKIFQFALKIIKGCLDHISDIDTIIKTHLVKWSFERMNLLDKALLRISIYELCYQNEIPAEVVFSEANRIADKYCEHKTPEYINGILNKVYNEFNKSKQNQK